MHHLDSALLSALLLTTAAARMEGAPACVANPGFGGSLALRHAATFSVTFAEPGWSQTHGGVDAPSASAGDGPHRFRVRATSDGEPTYVMGTAEFQSTADGGIHALWTATPEADVRAAEFFVGANFPAEDFATGSAVLDGGASAVPFPAAKGGSPHLFRGEASTIALRDRDGAERLVVELDSPTRILLQDNRHFGVDSFTLRLIFGEERTFQAGKPVSVGAAFRVPSAMPIVLGPYRDWKVEPGPDWVPIAAEPWIEPGSALDFTDAIPRHAPAGKFGRVRVVGDHFEFEGLPGVPQRFYGANVCMKANFPDRATGMRFAENAVRLGYNSIRLHHHDGGWAESDANRDNFDGLVAACVENGLYVTTDLFVSRPVPWRALGIDRDGAVPQDDFKILCVFHEPAYENLRAHAREFLCHVNPYTGRPLAHEPGLATLALVNEGNLGNHGVAALARFPQVREAWEKWLGEKGPDWAAIPRTLPASLYAPSPAKTPGERHAAAFAQFLADSETRFFRRLSAFVREECGCMAPLSDLSSWYEPVQNHLARSGFDYMDNHFYFAHPGFLDEPWKRPSHSDCGNPFRDGSAGVPGAAQRRRFGKPFCITEYNYCAPSPFRGVGGLAGGALAALQGWSGLWRFAWTHSLQGMEDPAAGGIGYFNAATDPLAIASERAAECLFLRGDAEELEESAPARFPESQLRDPAFGAPKSDATGDRAIAWRAKIGISLDDAPAAAEATPTRDSGAATRPGGRSAVVCDPARGTFAVATPRTAGGFAEKGALDCGPLSFEIMPSAESPSPATIWVSSLDGAPIRESGHLLLTHLTDVQDTGVRFADPGRTVLLQWGKPPHLMRAGSARVRLALKPATQDGSDAGAAFDVWRLSPSGHRLGQVPATYDAASGALTFTASTDFDPSSATYLYEITGHAKQ